MDNSNCVATMNTDHRAAIGPNNKSPLQSICEMLKCLTNALASPLIALESCSRARTDRPV